MSLESKIMNVLLDLIHHEITIRVAHEEILFDIKKELEKLIE